MKIIYVISYFLLGSILLSCDTTIAPINLSSGESLSNTEIIFNQKYAIQDSLIIENSTVIFQDTSVFEMGKNAKIIFKNCSVVMTNNHYVYFKPKKKSNFWDRLYFYNCNIKLSNARLEDGLMSCYNSEVHLDNIKLTTNNLRIKNASFPFIHLIKCTGIVQNCLLNNPVKEWTGEGIIVEDGMINVVKNTINNIPDAIELTRNKDVEIRDNIITNTLDDAIDLNACQNILVTNNSIFGAKDKGISIGSDSSFSEKLHPVKWGKSTNILIEQNTIRNTKTGIKIKDESTVTLKDNIFKNNKTNIDQ